MAWPTAMIWDYNLSPLKAKICGEGEEFEPLIALIFADGLSKKTEEIYGPW
jgi:hypothetical protein